MDNQLIKYDDFYKINSVTGLKTYQKVKQVLAEFDVNLKAEANRKLKDEETSSLNSSLAGAELRHQNMWDSGLKINQLV